MRMRVPSLTMLSGLKDPAMLQTVAWMWCCCGCGVGRWLGRRPAAVTLIQPLAWEPPCATGAALKRQKKWKIISSLKIANKFMQQVKELGKMNADTPGSDLYK